MSQAVVVIQMADDGFNAVLVENQNIFLKNGDYFKIMNSKSGHRRLHEVLDDQAINK